MESEKNGQLLLTTWNRKILGVLLKIRGGTGLPVRFIALFE